MSNIKQKIKEKVAYCGTRVLTGLGLATAALAAKPLFSGLHPDEIGLKVAGVLAVATVFNAAANKLGNAHKSPLLKKVQQTAVILCFAGVSAVHGLDQIVTDRENIQKSNEMSAQFSQSYVTGGLNDPEAEKYWKNILAGKTPNMNGFMLVASKTSANDLRLPDGNKKLTHNAR